MIHQRIIELITAVQPRVFNSLAPTKIVELFRLGEGDPPTLGLGTAEVVDGFYSFLGFTRLMSRAVIRKSVARGIEEGHFGYISGPKPVLSAQGKFEVAPTKVRFKTPVAEDEVDLDTGFLMLPQATPQPIPPTGDGSTPVGPGAGTPSSSGGVPGGVTPTPGGTGTGPVTPAPQKTVELTFTADQNKLFTAWNAIANLAALAGEVTVTVHAESEQGFDKSKLQNGVLEPLGEAGLID